MCNYPPYRGIARMHSSEEAVKLMPKQWCQEHIDAINDSPWHAL